MNKPKPTGRPRTLEKGSRNRHIIATDEQFKLIKLVRDLTPAERVELDHFLSDRKAKGGGK